MTSVPLDHHSSADEPASWHDSGRVVPTLAWTVSPGCYFDLSLPSIPAGASDLFRAPVHGIVVCDMPDCKCLISAVAAPADLSQMMESGRSKAGQKNGPGNRGHKSKVTEENVGARAERQTPILGSKPKIGEVAVAHCDTRRAHQQAVDRGHQAAEQGGGGREPNSGSLGHLSPLSWQAAGGRLVVCCQSMYTRCHQPLICLHGSILDFASQQNGVIVRFEASPWA